MIARARYDKRSPQTLTDFIIDCRMSRRYEPGGPGDDPLEPTIFQDGKTQGLQNPFQVDVYRTGALVRDIFLDVS